ncbi:glutamine--fructose-6-phosphate transaminase (isomerizing) [Fusibacter paucivorans]|uniref:Glutamine--fructose-6-phosphate aminotransferase [isomerizing] n=1 Tax=Fusibacter paucivorans TaxID=76009 RepID=A0ABS5PN88_9FIRM|nr:glutamine--fructose-6-phosphate transaminase (isomerizing) [Fusibacter paucivorans]MBS7526036.1 glutamine--fructose-6-phosphate transaminase (isomerizing) [Fusibacter paucivorans]
MCGIVGYIGEQKAIPFLIEGLSKLEYRGYDSAGIAINVNHELQVFKKKGRLKNLEDQLDFSLETVVGIGHTRWATHGAPSDENAHPHYNMEKTIAVIHNGIIENYMEIKEWLIESYGIAFASETDTEVIVHLIDHYYEGDLLEAVKKAVDRMEGAYAIGVIAKDEPDRLVAVRKDSPLIVGLGENENFIASDIPALLKYTRKMLLIENDEIVDLHKDNVTIYDDLGQVVKRDIFEVTWDIDAAEKEGYEHFTLKEIYEQPKGVKDTVTRRIDASGDLKLEGLQITKEDLAAINRIYIVACGTAYHAGLVGRRAIEKFAGIPVECDVASEFRYRDPFIDAHTLFIAVSQSGETLDTLQSIREAKRKGARVLSIVNVVGSSVSRESDDVFYTWAGPEIGVASTKAYTTQLTAFYLIALYFAKLNGYTTDSYRHEILKELLKMPTMIQSVLDKTEDIQKLAAAQFNNEKVFFMGRGVDCDLAFEGSLKLKEISYINSFAIAAGELKHGTIALIEEGTFVIAVATQDRLYDKMLSNIKEVKARGAHVFAIAQEGNTEIQKTADEVFYIPKTMDELAAITAIIPLQLFAYYVSLARGNDVDKPRNLAKSVTVE